jgi:glycine/D-amino acid oxidase-like deaminating enzyme
VIHTQVIIIGQGIAGINMALALEKLGISWLILDDGLQSASSAAAAGTINPVTGRHYVKSWLFEELKPVFKASYSRINDTFDSEIFRKLPIVRAIHSIKEENEWYARCEDDEYKEYITSKAILEESMTQNMVKRHAYGEIHQAFQVSLPQLLEEFRSKYQDSKVYLDQFDHSHLQFEEGRVKYKDFAAEKIVFCEGYKVLQNPLFSHLPFDPVKGEALIVKITNGPKKSLRDKIFITPIGEDLYWCGGSYSWKYTDHRPSHEGRIFVEENLNEILTQPYDIVDHVAGIRPSTKTRRPIAQVHEKYRNAYILNGLGTKGSSLAPYFARQLATEMYALDI